MGELPLPEDVRLFIKDVTLFLQSSRSKTPEQMDYKFQEAYRLYSKYDVENTRPTSSGRVDWDRLRHIINDSCLHKFKEEADCVGIWLTVKERQSEWLHDSGGGLDSEIRIKMLEVIKSIVTDDTDKVLSGGALEEIMDHIECWIARFKPRVDRKRLNRIIYQFMGWCSVRYTGNADCGISEDDIKKVDEFIDGIAKELNEEVA